MNSSELTSRPLSSLCPFVLVWLLKKSFPEKKKSNVALWDRIDVLLASDHEASGNGKPIKLTEICERSYT